MCVCAVLNSYDLYLVIQSNIKGLRRHRSTFGFCRLCKSPVVFRVCKVCVFLLVIVYVWWLDGTDGVWEGWCSIISFLQLCVCVYIQIFKPTHILSHQTPCTSSSQELRASHIPAIQFLCFYVTFLLSVFLMNY